jgi:hypothetical protein
MLVILSFTSGVTWAGDGFPPVSPEELKMTSEPLAPGAPAIILYRQVDRDDNSRPPHEDNYLRIKILSEEGLGYANAEITFVKDRLSVNNIRARTIKPNGAIVNFDGNIFEKTVIKGRGTKYLVKAFTLPDVQVGGIIEYQYTIDMAGHFYDSHWILSHELFTKNARFSLKRFEGDIPLLRPGHREKYSQFVLRWTWKGLPPGSEPKEGPDRIIRMEVANIPAFQTEDFMPPANELMSHVDFIYDLRILEADPDSFWKEFGKRRNGQLEDFVGKHKAMEQAVAEIVSPNDTPEAKLRKIYDRVQQFRNISYEVQRTQQEQKRDKEKIALNVEDVWKRGYGNGVQLTWLYLALVRAAGFEAYGVWVSSRGNYFFSPKTMEGRKLSANVVLVKLNGKDLYFDPGAAFTPFGLLTWYETGTPGLRLDKDGGSWIRSPLPASSESRIERTAKLRLSDTGDLEGTLTVSYTGLEAMYRRLEERNADEVERRKSLEDQVKAQIPAMIVVDLTNKPDWSSSETPLVAEFDLKIPAWGSNTGRRMLVPAGAFTQHEKHIFEHSNRIHPIYFRYPFENLDDITIELPPGWQVDSIPPAQKQDAGAFQYSFKVERKNDKLHLVRRLSVDAMFMERSYYPSLRKFFQSVRTGDEEQIVLQSGVAAASN